ncbi:hypothetical protein SAMN04488515_2739 [Cognatiyoonia koreensis]|uniref:Uncharacterized protein n=1 Tax=Cognatiyoonia koreensis TaxID=364200 RepID=A0A1I0RIN0_9RHOB|nr:hypothetical protein SAMN04488515_2739 [Cognatiyoonia koreensis]
MRIWGWRMTDIGCAPRLDVVLVPYDDGAWVSVDVEDTNLEF